eukprot:341149-Alexandrium_andersonii.AAC.1
MSNAPGYFDKMFLTSQAITALEDHNKEVEAGRRNKKIKPWNWDHLIDGFYGTHCPDISRHETLQQEDVVRLWGYSMYASMARGALKLKKQRTG